MVKATIFGNDKIIVTNGKSTLGTYRFDGEKLIGVAGRTISFASSDKVEAIAKAISEYVPDSYVTKFGGEMTEDDRMLGGWELKNENIDVINWTSNIQLLIQRSLTPAKITSMELDNENKHANVYLKPDQVSLAIGRRGVNIKLASELTGYELDVYRDNEGEVEEFDIDLEEFSDEIETWIIDELKRVGCDTARSVLALTPEELERRTDLEKETIDELRKVLKEEFEKE